ncbi:carboxylesterase family protein [Streptomyces sp. NBC_01483]|uniref:carboxylesterase family protein n=1 Tax=Streptomyces sp. NBC_01483 TaxID=2903883 RepID=UPI002E2F8E7D|nr:carboxylesterase family protein [Streptomyces sp. NBC_01483]
MPGGGGTAAARAPVGRQGEALHRLGGEGGHGGPGEEGHTVPIVEPCRRAVWPINRIPGNWWADASTGDRISPGALRCLPGLPRGHSPFDGAGLALRWARRSISAFGDDPNRVTITGRSAGGASVVS